MRKTIALRLGKRARATCQRVSFGAGSTLLPWRQQARNQVRGYVRHGAERVLDYNVPWIERVADVHALDTDERKPIATLAHRTIAHHVGVLVEMLAADLLVPESMMVLSGCGGIGKTTALEAICRAVSRYRPSIIPVFVTLGGPSVDRPHWSLPVVLRERVADRLSADHPDVAHRLRLPTRGSPSQDSPRAVVDDVVRALRKTDKRLPVVADQVERVYMLPNDPTPTLGRRRQRPCGDGAMRLHGVARLAAHKGGTRALVPRRRFPSIVPAGPAVASVQAPTDVSTPDAVGKIARMDWSQVVGVYESRLHDILFSGLLGSGRPSDAKRVLDRALDRQQFVRSVVRGGRIVMPASPRSIIASQRRATRPTYRACSDVRETEALLATFADNKTAPRSPGFFLKK
jgi:hypothetical protein